MLGCTFSWGSQVPFLPIRGRVPVEVSSENNQRGHWSCRESEMMPSSLGAWTGNGTSHSPDPGQALAGLGSGLSRAGKAHELTASGRPAHPWTWASTSSFQFSEQPHHCTGVSPHNRWDQRLRFSSQGQAASARGSPHRQYCHCVYDSDRLRGVWRSLYLEGRPRPAGGALLPQAFERLLGPPPPQGAGKESPPARPGSWGWQGRLRAGRAGTSLAGAPCFLDNLSSHLPEKMKIGTTRQGPGLSTCPVLRL